MKYEICECCGKPKKPKADAAISSPPYSSVVDGSGEGPGTRWDFTHHAPDNARKQSSAPGYGRTPGNLGNMPGYDAAVSSSPFASSAPIGNPEHYEGFEHVGSVQRGQEYAKSRVEIYNKYRYLSPEWLEHRKETAKRQNIGRLPEEAKDPEYPTFWSESRKVLEQTFAALKPGGVAAFVTGDFVRDGRRVEFGRQWLALCEAVGFVPLEHAVAWKREPGPVQSALAGIGEDRDHTVDRVSFFRRLANQNNPEAAVLNEDVWIIRRPGEQNQ